MDQSPSRFGRPPELISASSVQRRIRELAHEISGDYAGRNPVFIGVLTGAFIFVADLIREIQVPVEVDFIRANSYGNARVSSGAVRLSPETALDWVGGKDIIFAEDILDTGRTLNAVVDLAHTRGARSVASVVLLRKPAPQPAADTRIQPEYVGFDIESRFVVGYGLDDGGKWRNLPYVGYVD
jgi:hypoxanthine phosphoribosyltransferase